MRVLFFDVLNMSLTASGIILAVMLARLVLRKVPKVFSYALWTVVLFRLLCPFTIESALSLIPSTQPIPPEAVVPPSYYTDGEVPVVRTAAEYFLLGDVGPSPANAGPDVYDIAAVVWLAGAVLLLGYSLISLLRLRRKLVGWVPLEGEKGVRLVDHIPSPFVLGISRPAIYLPSDLAEEERDHILLHERTHIRRWDHIFRALAWLAVAVHWFNPLVWLAFHLAGKDMEMSCDEAVLRKMGRDVRADYSTSLLRLSQGGKLPAGPLAFGGGDPASRIKNVLGYKRPPLGAVVLAMTAVLCAVPALATDQKQLFIDPNSITAVTGFNATRHTTTPQHTGIYTPEDRWEDLNDPQDAVAAPVDAAAELVRLINSFNKTVYAQGDFALNGWEHHFYRLDCTDGGFYLVDYWYWSGFNWNLFIPAGEDPYTTLVTRFDAEGNAGTTWQMEYYFDRAYKKWRSSWTDNSGASAPVNTPANDPVNEPGNDRPNDPADGLVFTLREDEARVMIDGGKTIYTWWHVPDHTTSLGYLSFGSPEEDGEWLGGTAEWTDEDRNAIFLVLTAERAQFSYTVRTEPGLDTAQAVSSFHIAHQDEGGAVPVDEEKAVEMARLFAGHIRAAEAFYADSGADPPVVSSSALETVPPGTAP